MRAIHSALAALILMLASSISLAQTPVADSAATETAPVAIEQSAEAATAPTPEAIAQPAETPLNPVAPTAPAAPAKERLEIGGYAKVGFGYQQADPVVDYIGHSNGFQMAGARLELIARPADEAEVALSIEGALDRPTDRTGVSGEKLVSLRDAYLKYTFLPYLVVTLGQFKAPFSAEALTSDKDLVFFDRSIVTRGKLPPEGYAADGITLDRQLGLSLSSERIALGSLGLRYALGVFNGNGANRLLNDNQDVTPAGRLEVDFQQLVTLGVAGYLNPRTAGERPDLLKETDTAFTADLSANIAGFRVLAAYLMRDRAYETVVTDAPNEKAWGLLAQISWRHEGTGLEPAYRLAMLSPSDLSAFEKVTHHTIGLNWKPSDRPLRVFLAYSLRQEQAERELKNDGFEAGAQLNF